MAIAPWQQDRAARGGQARALCCTARLLPGQPRCPAAQGSICEQNEIHTNLLTDVVLPLEHSHRRFVAADHQHAAAQEAPPEQRAVLRMQLDGICGPEVRRRGRSP